MTKQVDDLRKLAARCFDHGWITEQGWADNGADAIERLRAVLTEASELLEGHFFVSSGGDEYNDDEVIELHAKIGLALGTIPSSEPKT